MEGVQLDIAPMSTRETPDLLPYFPPCPSLPSA